MNQPNEESISFGQWLKRRRQALDMTQDQLAELVGYASPTLRKIERGERRPSRALAERLAAALQIAPEQQAAFMKLARAAGAPAGQPAAPSSPEPPRAAPPLLVTKIQPPPLRAATLPRARLTSQIATGQPGTLTLLVAPAGWGKTTLARAWLAGLPPQAQARVAWLTFEPHDSDPVTVLRYLIAAIGRAEPGCGASALALLESQPPALDVVQRLLANDLASLVQPLTLILDDYHVLRELATHRLLIELIERVLPAAHLLIASREDPPLPLARLRARGQLTEIRAADLRFSADEAAGLLSTVMRLNLDPATVGALAQRTEGWATGLMLAAHALRERPDPAAFVRDFSGSHRLVLDYLAEEVLGRLPDHLLQFLLHTSILERLCGPLCDAVMGVDAPDMPAEAYTQHILNQLERNQLFLIPLDETRTWYRYHHLFGEVIGARLARGASPAALRALHERAATWHAGQGLWQPALRHALLAQRWDLVADAIEQVGEELLLQQAVGRLRELIAGLPEPLRAERPRLLLLQAMAERRDNNFAAAGSLLAQAAAGAAARGDLALQGEALVHLADNQRSSGSYLAAHQSLQAALAAPLPPRTRVSALISRSYEALAAGDWPACTAALDQALGLVLAGADRWQWLELAINAHSILLILPGQVAWAERFIRAPLPWPEPPLSPLRAALLWIEGYAHLLRGAPAQAAAAIAQSLAIGAQLGGNTKLEVDAGLQLAFVAALGGDLPGAERQLAALLAVLAQPALAVYSQVWGACYRYFQGWLRIQQGRLSEAAALAAAESPQPSEWPIAACARLMLRGLVAVELGDLAAAEQALQAAAREQAGRADAFLFGDARMPLAYAALRAGRPADAAAHLRAACAHQLQRGTPGVLLMSGRAITVSLCQHAHEQQIHASLAASLLRALGAEPAPPPPPTGADPDALTARESEVLRLMAQGASNQAIAGALVISLPTAKTHAARILAKLGAANRTAAIAIARERGLL